MSKKIWVGMKTGGGFSVSSAERGDNETTFDINHGFKKEMFGLCGDAATYLPVGGMNEGDCAELEVLPGTLVHAKPRTKLTVRPPEDDVEEGEVSFHLKTSIYDDKTLLLQASSPDMSGWEVATIYINARGKVEMRVVGGIQDKHFNLKGNGCIVVHPEV